MQTEEKICPRCHQGRIGVMTPEEVAKLKKRINSQNPEFGKEPIVGCDECQFWMEQDLYEQD